MRPLRVGPLVGVAVLGTLLGAFAFDRAQVNGATPLPLPWPAAVVMTFLALGILAAGREVRRWIRGTRTKPLSAVAAARVAVAATAAGWTGAVLAGWYGGQALALTRALVGDRSTRFTIAAFSAAAALLLSAAGVVAQRWCRPPPRDDVTA